MTMGEFASTTLLSWGGTGREEMVSVHSGKLGHGALAMTRELKSGFYSSVNALRRHQGEHCFSKSGEVTAMVVANTVSSYHV